MVPSPYPQQVRAASALPTGSGFASRNNFCFHVPLWPPAPKCLSLGRVHTSCDGTALCHENKTRTKNKDNKQRKACLDLPLLGVLHPLEMSDLFSFAFLLLFCLSASNTYRCATANSWWMETFSATLRLGQRGPGPSPCFGGHCSGASWLCAFSQSEESRGPCSPDPSISTFLTALQVPGPKLPTLSDQDPPNRAHTSLYPSLSSPTGAPQ